MLERSVYRSKHRKSVDLLGKQYFYPPTSVHWARLMFSTFPYCKVHNNNVHLLCKSRGYTQPSYTSSYNVKVYSQASHTLNRRTLLYIGQAYPILLITVDYPAPTLLSSLIHQGKLLYRTGAFQSQFGLEHLALVVLEPTAPLTFGCCTAALVQACLAAFTINV